MCSACGTDVTFTPKYKFFANIVDTAGNKLTTQVCDNAAAILLKQSATVSYAETKGRDRAHCINVLTSLIGMKMVFTVIRTCDQLGNKSQKLTVCVPVPRQANSHRLASSQPASASPSPTKKPRVQVR